MRRVVFAEDALIALIMMSACWVFTLGLTSHFTLPKLLSAAVFTGLLQIPFYFRSKYGYVNTLPRFLLYALVGLVLWWSLSTTVNAVHLQTALEGQPGRFNGFYTGLILLIIFTTVARIPMDEERLKRIILLLILAMLPVALYAFVQYIGLDRVFQKPAGMRPPSSIGNPVAFAVVLLLLMPMIYGLSRAVGRPQSRLNYLLVLGIFVSVFLMSGSRGPWLGAAAVITFVLFIEIFALKSLRPLFNARVLAGAQVVIGLLVLLITTTPIAERFYLGAGFEARIMYFTAGLQIIADSPLFGFGFESYKMMYPGYRPMLDAVFYRDVMPTMIHNDYLQYAADNGIISALLYLTIVLGVFWLLWQAYRNGRGNRHLLLGSMGMVLGYLVQAFSGWLEAAALIMFWLMLGVSLAYVLTIRQDAASRHIIADEKKAGSLLPVVNLILFTGFAAFYVITMFNLGRADYTLRVAKAYAPVDFSVTRRYIRKLEDMHLFKGNFFFNDHVGLLYLNRILVEPRLLYYQKAAQHFELASNLNPFDPYFQIHIIENDVLGLKHGFIKAPSSAALQAMDKIAQMDPNNHTVHRVRAKMFLALGKMGQVEAAVKRMREIEAHRETGRMARGMSLD